MNQTEQMREPCPSCRNADIYACTCPFKTARNSQPECFEPAKLVRLTEDDVATAWNLAHENTISHAQYDPERFDFNFANAIMDAMIAKNGGSHATD